MPIYSDNELSPDFYASPVTTALAVLYLIKIDPYRQRMMRLPKEYHYKTNDLEKVASLVRAGAFEN